MNQLLFWPLLYAVTLSVSALLGYATFGVGNAVFVAGALAILASVGFVGAGGETRIKIVRNITGFPVTLEKVDPVKRQAQISTGMKVFLLGLALWAPLVYLTFR